MKFRRATLDDVRFVADAMRERDRAEVYDLAGESPYAALFRLLHVSQPALAVLDDLDGVVAMCGVVPQGATLSRVGSPWMLASRYADEPHFRRDVARHSRGNVRALMRAYGYSYFGNWISAKQKVHIRWLQWVGFTVHPPVSFGCFGEDFHYFELRRRV